MLSGLQGQRWEGYELRGDGTLVMRRERASLSRYATGVQTVGRLFFGLGFVGLACTHFIFRAFTTGRAPVWPAPMPGGTLWAYLSGTAFLLIGLAVISGKQVRPTIFGTAAVIFAWAFVRQLPVAAADGVLASTWTHAGKALTLIGGLCVTAGASPFVEESVARRFARVINLEMPFITVGRCCLAVFLLITGIQHFLYTEFVATLIPEWFPGNAVMWTQFAGVALISGGVGLVVARTARLAALLVGIMVFSWFWIVHLPRALMSVSDGIAVFEALAVSGIALMIAGFLFRREMGR